LKSADVNYIVLGKAMVSVQAGGFSPASAIEATDSVAVIASCAPRAATAMLGFVDSTGASDFVAAIAGFVVFDNLVWLSPRSSISGFQDS
jgi:hypothetical protein